MSLAITTCFHVCIIYKQFIYRYLQQKEYNSGKDEKPKKITKISMFYLNF